MPPHHPNQEVQPFAQKNQLCGRFQDTLWTDNESLSPQGRDCITHATPEMAPIMMNQNKIIQVMRRRISGGRTRPTIRASVSWQMKGLYFQPNGGLPCPSTLPLDLERRRKTLRADAGSKKLQKTHKGRKLSRWMTPPTAIAAIASFHVHAVLHIIHSPCICVQQPASTSKREALLLSTCHRKPTQPGSSVPSTPPGSDPNLATRRKALHQYARGRKTHATTLHAPPTPGYCLHGAITHRSRWHSFNLRISSGPYCHKERSESSIYRQGASCSPRRRPREKKGVGGGGTALLSQHALN